MVCPRYKLENGNTPPKPHISEPVEADLLDHFEMISTLVSTLGYTAFEKVVDLTLRFTKDHVFNSPSTAAGVVTACNANGWTAWKYSDGKTLDEVKRKV